MAEVHRPFRFDVAFSFAGPHRETVRRIAELVAAAVGRERVFFDEWYEYEILGDDMDVLLQRFYHEQSLLVLADLSDDYAGRKWCQAEARAIRALRFELDPARDETGRLRLLNARFGTGNVPGTFVTGGYLDAVSKSPEQCADLILKRLELLRQRFGAGRAPAPDRSHVPLSWPGAGDATPTWTIADHTEARDAFAELLSANPPWRCVMLRGSSETGKSHITHQMLANAIRLPGLACGRFDFKGTTDVDAEIRALVQHLDVPVPPAPARLNERLSHVLDALKARPRPSLLIFDTYEAAGDARDWVEKQLLLRLMREPWLRVVIAGQDVPKRAGAIWESIARQPLDLTPPPPEAWIAYAGQHRPDVTLEFIREAHHLCRGKASVLAELLGPRS